MLLDISFYGALTIDSSGKFSYVQNHSENFKDSFSYQISDGLFKYTAWVYISIIPTNDLKIEAKGTFKINITAVNDTPHIDSSFKITVNEDTGSVSVSNWTNSISVGPTNESSQTILELQIIG